AGKIADRLTDDFSFGDLTAKKWKGGFLRASLSLDQFDRPEYQYAIPEILTLSVEKVAELKGKFAKEPGYDKDNPTKFFNSLVSWRMPPTTMEFAAADENADGVLIPSESMKTWLLDLKKKVESVEGFSALGDFMVYVAVESATSTVKIDASTCAHVAH